MFWECALSSGNTTMSLAEVAISKLSLKLDMYIAFYLVIVDPSHSFNDS